VERLQEAASGVQLDADQRIRLRGRDASPSALLEAAARLLDDLAAK
jgi:hypothetical protein